MFPSLIKSIQKFGDFSPEDQATIVEQIQVRKFRKDEFLLKEGGKSQSLYFIASGSIRHFKDLDGYSHLTINLFVEGDWVFDHHSFIGQKPSENYIQVFEDSTLLELTLDSLHLLIGRSPSFFRLGKILENAKKAEEVSNQSPEEKYRSLLESSPSIIQQFPLKYIASYLGMTPETLSRVRAKIRA